MRVFLDANVLFSAAKTDGAVRQLLHLLRAQGHECQADAYVVAEARRNLGVKGPQALVALEAPLLWVQVAPHAPGGLPQALQAEVPDLPEKDRPVLGAAIHLGCDVLVTGDRTHFGPCYGKRIGGVLVHSPGSLALHILSPSSP